MFKYLLSLVILASCFSVCEAQCYGPNCRQSFSYVMPQYVVQQPVTNYDTTQYTNTNGVQRIFGQWFFFVQGPQEWVIWNKFTKQWETTRITNSGKPLSFVKLMELYRASQRVAAK